MKKLFFTAVLITVILMSGTAQTSSNELTGKSWKLEEVRINNVNTGFTRSDLPKISRAAVGSFTLIFDDGTISGIGAPNHYIAPYTRTNNQISVSVLATTKLAPIPKLDKINEQEYFIYLKNAGDWYFDNYKLVLNSKTADGKAVIMVFIL